MSKRDSNEFIGAKGLDTIWTQSKAKFFAKVGTGADTTLVAISGIGANQSTEVVGILRKTTTGTWAVDTNEYVKNVTADTDGIYFDRTSATGGNGTRLTLTRAQLRKVLHTDDNDGNTKLVTLDSNGKLRVSEMPDFILGQLVYGGTLSWSDGVCKATLSTNGMSKLGVSGSTVTIVNSATGTGGAKGWKDCDGLFFISNFDAVDGTWPKTIGSQSDNKGIMKGDWLVPVVDNWDKIDNTDAVTGISIGDYDGATHTTKLGTVVIDADTLHVLSTTKTSKQRMKSDLYTEGALEAKNGVSAKGIHDLEQAGSGGGGTGGISVETSWDDVDPSSETQVVTANLSKQTKVAVDGLGDEVDALGTRVGSLEGKFDGEKANQAKVADKVGNKLTVGSKQYDGSGAVSITPTDLGLGNVDNTSDMNKPVSTAQQAALTNLSNGLSSEITARKGVDLTDIEVGAPKSRGANPTTPALKFKHTSGSIDIARGTEVDIVASNISGDALPSTNQLFSYRTTAGSASIKPTGTAHIDKLLGNTIVWNQLVSGYLSGSNGFTYTVNNGYITITGTAESTPSYYQQEITIPITTKRDGTRYLFLLNKPMGYLWGIIGYGANRAATTDYAMFCRTEGGTWTAEIFVYVTEGTTLNIQNLSITCHNLTQMFGTTDTDILKGLGMYNDDGTLQSWNDANVVARFRELFPLPYYSYNAGKLISFGAERRVFRQLVENGNFESSDGWGIYSTDYGTFSVENNEGIIRHSGGSVGSTGTYEMSLKKKNGSFVFTSNHKFYLSIDCKCSKSGSLIGELTSGSGVSLGSVVSEKYSHISQMVDGNGYSSGFVLRVNLSNGAKYADGDITSYRNFNIFDLTETFGAGNEPTTVEEVERYLKEQYYPYNVATELSDADPEIETVGRNLWDEEWENGTYTNGVKTTSTNNIRSKNYIPIIPNTRYRGLFNMYAVIFYYDASKNYISSYSTNSYSEAFTTPANASYMTFFIGSGYGTTYKHDICISLAWSGSRTGYEPYEKHTKTIKPYIPDEFKTKAYALGDLVLHNGAMYKRTANGGVRHTWKDADWTMVRSAGGGVGQALSVGCVHDEYYADHCVIRIGAKVFDGTEWWRKHTTRGCFTTKLYNVKINTNNSQCNLYIRNDSANILSDSDKTYAIRNWDYGDGFNVFDSAYADESAWRSRLASLYSTGTPLTVYYELAEPIVINYEQDMDYWCDDYGTEEWTPSNGAVPRMAFPLMDITYGINVADTVRQIPATYATKEQVPEVQLIPEYDAEDVNGFTMIVNDEEVTMSEMSEDTILRICNLD